MRGVKLLHEKIVLNDADRQLFLQTLAFCVIVGLLSLTSR